VVLLAVALVAEVQIANKKLDRYAAVLKNLREVAAQHEVEIVRLKSCVAESAKRTARGQAIADMVDHVIDRADKLSGKKLGGVPRN